MNKLNKVEDEHFKPYKKEKNNQRKTMQKIYIDIETKIIEIEIMK